MPGPNDPQSPYGQQDVSLDDLRRIRSFFGIQPGSPIDTGVKGAASAPGSLLTGAGSGLGDAWKSLSQAPPKPLQAGPGAPANLQTPGRPGGSLSPTPTTGELMGARNPGSMSMELSGPGPFNKDVALQGLKAAQQGPSAVPSMDLWKQAFAQPSLNRDPLSYRYGEMEDTVAPGARQWAGDELKTRTGDDDFTRLLQQQQQTTVAGAQTQLNPQVRAAQEANAAISPAAIAGQAEVTSAGIAANSPYQTALAQMMLGAGGNGDLRSISKSGVSFAPQSQIPPSLLQALQKAQSAAGGLDMFGSNAANLKRTQMDALNAMQISPKLKQAMMQLVANPRAPMDASQFSPEERQELDYLHSFLGLQ